MNNSPLRILLVAETGADFSAVRSVPLLETVAYGDPLAAFENERLEEFDALVLDASLQPIEATSLVAARCPQLPIILVARSAEQEDESLRALECGADDYLMESDLSPITICGALRNARRYRQAVAERDAQQQAAAVPQHLCERLATSLGVVQAFADTMECQLDDHPAAAMAGTMLDEIHQLQMLATDLTDERRLQSGNLIIHRQTCELGELAQVVLHRAAGRDLQVRGSTQWKTPVICDQEKLVRAISRIIESLRLTAPAAELQLVVDELQPRLGLQWSQGSIEGELAERLLDTTPVGAGEPGFERVVALGLLKSQQVEIDVDLDTLWFDAPTSLQTMTSRWTDSLDQQATAGISLFEVTASSALVSDEALDLDATQPIDPLELLDTFDWVSPYLQQSVASQDLVLAPANDRWLVALAGDVTSAERRMRHLMSTAKVVDANATLHAQRLATFQWPLEREALEERLQQAIRNRRVLVLDRKPTPLSPVSRRLTEAGYDVVSLADDYAIDDAHRATAIVGDARSLDDWEGAELPNLPMFLIGTLKDQQRALQENVRFITHGDDEEEGLDGLLDALQLATEIPAPFGFQLHPATEKKHD